ncbi:MAG TPA: dicarboxylate/amino acid:cation symporter [Sphingobacterium sp.]|nr:dicarboxylate/amino acid:cation symporter [Sphingobacterium sp.]
MHETLRNYSNIILLLLGIIVGSLLGIYTPAFVPYLKPIGDIFLNLIFVSIIPLLFFAITASVSNINKDQPLGRVMLIMSAVFIVTIVVVSIFTILAVWMFPIEGLTTIAGSETESITQDNAGWGDRLVSFLTVSEFGNLLSRQNILAFVIFSFLLGISVRNAGPQGETFSRFIKSGNEVMQQLLTLIMKIAPLGLGAYFAYQVYDLGPQLFGIYGKPLGLYYIAGIVFFFVGFSFYAFLSYGKRGVHLFWKNNIIPSLTAVSTCSSLATLPTNLEAARKIGIPDSIASIVIPLGNTLYKNGSAISSIVKIYVAFAICGWNFFETEALILAVGITLLVSIVAGGIPNGGYIGEMLMISIYGLPDYAVPAVLIIGTLVDPLATILNATGDTVAAMLVTKFSKQKFDTGV